MFTVKQMRIPTCEDWDRLVQATDGNDDLMHWKHVFSYCLSKKLEPNLRVLSYRTATYWDYESAVFRYAGGGFRPVFEVADPASLGPVGTVVAVGTLYMGGEPVKIPTQPTCTEDYTYYAPDAKLEIREALDDPAYQVRAIVVGRTCG